MKRNNELAKEILEIVSSEDNSGGGLYRSEILGVFTERYSSQEDGLEPAVSYHLHLLETAGFLKITRTDHDDDNFEMTWAGHDFMEANELEISAGPQ